MGRENRLRTNARHRANGLGWHLLIYRMPTEPASKRVSVWRDLHRLGALYLQQCVCVLPAMEGPNAELSRITSKIPVARQ
jgi:DNA-binding transcriptional regulator PaaX